MLADKDAPEFDPTELCEELAALSSDDPERDRLLMLHTGLALILAQWLNSPCPHRRQAVSDEDLGEGLIFLTRMDRWHAKATISDSDLTMLLPIYGYGLLRINRAAEQATDRNGLRQSFTIQARTAASSLLRSMEKVHSHADIAVLPKIYIEAICAAGFVVLSDSRDSSDGASMAYSSDPDLDQLERLAEALLSGPLPRDHWVPSCGEMLYTGVQHLRQSTTFRY